MKGLKHEERLRKQTVQLGEEGAQGRPFMPKEGQRSQRRLREKSYGEQLRELGFLQAKSLEKGRLRGDLIVLDNYR